MGIAGKKFIEIRVPLEDDATARDAELAEAVLQQDHPDEAFLRRAAENGLTLEELIAEFLIEKGVLVGEDEFTVEFIP